MQQILACLLLLTLSGAACAAPSKQVVQYSSRDAYRACLDEKDQIDISRVEYEAKLAEHDKKVAQFDADAKAHAARVNGQSAINFADERSNALSARSVELNAAGQKLAAASQDFEASIASHNQRCAGMVVRMQDREAVHKERARQGKKS